MVKKTNKKTTKKQPRRGPHRFGGNAAEVGRRCVGHRAVTHSVTSPRSRLSPTRSPDKSAQCYRRQLGKLHDLPARGNDPKELVALGFREWREVFFKPYRIIYRVIGKDVYVYLFADGRRDMQSLLAWRLLGA